MAAAGVVNRTVAEEALIEEATAFAHKLANGPTRAYGAHKALLRAWTVGGVPPNPAGGRSEPHMHVM